MESGERSLMNMVLLLGVILVGVYAATVCRSCQTASDHSALSLSAAQGYDSRAAAAGAPLDQKTGPGTVDKPVLRVVSMNTESRAPHVDKCRAPLAGE